jgi:hypothetical protein
MSNHICVLDRDTTRAQPLLTSTDYNTLFRNQRIDEHGQMLPGTNGQPFTASVSTRLAALRVAEIDFLMRWTIGA